MTKAERWDKATQVPLLVLGLAFLIAYATPIIDPTLPVGLRDFFEDVELITWVAFAIDFVVRLATTDRRWHFIKTHPLDVAAVVLPVLRPLRALRVLSIVFLTTRRLSKVLRNRVLTYVVVTAISVWFIAGLAVTDAERGIAGANIHSVWDGWWWSFITMATVGYGDVYPLSLEGRFVAVGLVITGIGLVGTVTAYIASWFAAATRDAEIAITAELGETEDKVDRLTTEVRELRALLAQLVDRQPVDAEREDPRD
jgi:voltage-gated potassium channel